MKITPTLEECKIIAAEGSYGVIPISTELYADMTTPIEVLRILKKVSGHVYLLESAEADKRWGRYSFLVKSASDYNFCHFYNPISHRILPL